MRSLTTVPFLVRGAMVALVVIMTVVVVAGPAGFGPEPQSAEAALLSEVKKLLASDAQAGDLFGARVAVSGDTAVVGANFEAAGGSGAGAAYVVQRAQGGAGNWGQVKKLTASDAQLRDFFGRVAISGDTAVVGAFGEDDRGGGAGAAYVFQQPVPVGGISVDLDSDQTGLPLETHGSSGVSTGVLADLAVAAAAAALALGGAAWYARRRGAR